MNSVTARNRRSLMKHRNDTIGVTELTCVRLVVRHFFNLPPLEEIKNPWII